MTELRLYFEGAKESPGFDAFLATIKAAAENKGVRLRLVNTCGKPASDFLKGRQRNKRAWNVLLLDSDRPDDGKLFARLQEQYALPGSTRGSVFWMVQLMEAWFLADPEGLAGYYGQKFNRTALKKNPRVEEIRKADVESCLKQATKKTGRPYESKTGAKTLDAPKILAAIDPAKVRAAAPNCERLFAEILNRLE